MKIGIIGLGKMGSGIAQRLNNNGYSIVAYDATTQACDYAREQGACVVDSVRHVAEQCSIIWLLLPAGALIDAVLQEIVSACQAHTIIIDGGNSHYRDSMRRAQEYAGRIVFLDCGTSGGLYGRVQGYCLMVGGERAAYDTVVPLLYAIAAPGGFAYVGASGAGHYVKMVHNGIEYGLLQAYAEGIQLLHEGSFKNASLDLAEITRVWSCGAVIRSWLLERAHEVLAHDQKLESISGVVEENGTGRWAAEEAHAHHIPVPVLEAALSSRAQSRATGGNYATKLIALLRQAFGGHSIKKL